MYMFTFLIADFDCDSLIMFTVEINIKIDYIDGIRCNETKCRITDSRSRVFTMFATYNTKSRNYAAHSPLRTLVTNGIAYLIYIQAKPYARRGEMNKIIINSPRHT